MGICTLHGRCMCSTLKFGSMKFGNGKYHHEKGGSDRPTFWHVCDHGWDCETFYSDVVSDQSLSKLKVFF
jgi:hypothetical protein